MNFKIDIIMKVTVFKEKPYSEKYIHPLTGKACYNIMEYPPNYVDIQLVFDIIREERLKSRIDKARAYYNSDRVTYEEIKGKLPICLFAGAFRRFSNDGLITPSGLVTVDLDKIPIRDLLSVWNMIIHDDYTFAAFLSPSGRGYKILVRVDGIVDNVNYNNYLEALKDYHNSPFWDDNCKGVCRACYLSSDPNLYMNNNSKIWTQKKSVFSTPSVVNTNSQSRTPICSTDELSRIINFLEGGFGKYPMIQGNRHGSAFKRAREFAEWGISKATAYTNLAKYIAPDFPESELKREIRKAYEWVEKKNGIGSKYRKI